MSDSDFDFFYKALFEIENETSGFTIQEKSWLVEWSEALKADEGFKIKEMTKLLFEVLRPIVEQGQPYYLGNNFDHMNLPFAKSKKMFPENLDSRLISILKKVFNTPENMYQVMGITNAEGKLTPSGGKNLRTVAVTIEDQE